MLSNKEIQEYLEIKNSGDAERRIGVRMNPKEFESVKKISMETGISLSEFIRRAIFKATRELLISKTQTR